MATSEADVEQRHDQSTPSAASKEEQHEIDRMRAVLDRQRAEVHRAEVPSYHDRIAKLDKLLHLVRTHQDEIADAIIADYGQRSRHETLMAEVFTVVSQIKYTRKKLRKWMKPQRREVHFPFKPAKAKILYQPKGVVGIIAPWNYPFYLSAMPLVTALAAGNRVMIKPSEVTPETAALTKRLLGEVFDETEVAVFTGGPEVGKAFSSLPFDHLFFTGSTALGRIIMRAASRNLTPVTLELGGKSPLIIHRDYPLDKAVQRIVAGKYMNAGQTCVAPDYVFVPEDRTDDFIAEFRSQIADAYPSIADNPDYTAVVNERHYDRVLGYIEDARGRGAEVIEVNPADEEIPRQTRKIPPTVVLGTDDEMEIMQDEIFGPLLPVKTYRDVAEAVDYVNAHPRPLAFYYFDRDRSRAERVLRQTISGNACVNETVLHVGQDDLPFGGIGDSGMGAYHGIEGFETFSHKKGVFYQSRLNGANLLRPPYDQKILKAIKFLIGR